MKMVWRLSPPNCVIYHGVVYPLWEEITTGEAAKILGLHRVTVSKMCDQGQLKEGEHWHRLGDRGYYLIRKDVIMELQRQKEAKRKGR